MMEEEIQKEGEQEQGMYGMQRLTISSSIVSAYLASLVKAALLIGGLIGAYFLVLHLLGENPFEGVLDIIGIPFIWVTRAVMAILAFIFIAIIFDTLSLTSYELVFEGDRLTYSYGSFFKITRSTDIANIVRVNFNEYGFFGLGDIVVEFTGTEERRLKVRYVGHALRQCELVNRLVNLKKSETLAGVDQMGVEA